MLLQMALFHSFMAEKQSSGASLVAQQQGIRLQCRRHGFNPRVRKISWRRKWQPIPILVPGKFHGQKSLARYSPWGQKTVKHDLAVKQQRYCRQMLYPLSHQGIPTVLYIYHIFFIHSSIDEFSDCFHVLPIVIIL